jgi:hypothetical protein
VTILIGLVILVGLLCHGRIFSLSGFFWDDTAWMYSLYSTGGLGEFLDTGFLELRRPGMGVFLYLLLLPHKLGFHPHLIWDIIQLSIILGAAVLLFFFCRNLFRSDFLAFSSAALLAVYALDATIAVNVQSVYRLGVLVGIASFLCTERALAQGMAMKYYAGAVLLQIFGLLVTLESLVALEPARMALIWYVLGRRDASGSMRARMKQAALYCAPFLAVAALEVGYKMTFRPYGVYAGFYETKLANLLDPEGFLAVGRYLLLGHWAGLGTGASGLGSVAAVGTLFAAFVALFSFIFPARGERDPHSLNSAAQTLAAAGALGALLLLFPAVLHVYAGKIPSLIDNSRHGDIFMFGYALALGTAVEGVRRLGGRRRLSGYVAVVLLSGYLAAGVFYANANIDAFKRAWRGEQRFWEAFTKRYPAPPERAVFMFDSDFSEGIYDGINGIRHYQFLFPLNLLYARSADAEEFARYAAFSFRLHGEKLKGPKFSTSDNWHSYIVNRDLITFVFWYNGRLYVNNEVLRARPALAALGFLDKDAPSFTGSPGLYVYRDRWP